MLQVGSHRARSRNDPRALSGRDPATARATDLFIHGRAGTRPSRTAALPKLARALGASVEALLGKAAGSTPLAPLTENPGHVGELERAFDEVRKLPRRQQKRVLEFVVAFVNEYKKAC